MKLRSKAAIGILAFIVIIGCAGSNTGGTPAPNLPETLPELTPYIPAGWSAPVIFDRESLSFKIAWTNQGDAMAEGYTIVLLLDGNTVAKWYKPVTAPGNIKTQSVGLRDIPNPASLMNGRHKVELIIGPQNTVAESDEENNYFSAQQYFSFELPDLKPHLPAKLRWDQPVVFGGGDLVFGIRPPPADGGYYMAYSVINSGRGAAKSWGGLTQLSVNGLTVRQSYIEQIGDQEPQPGAFVITAVPVWKIALMEGPLLPGTYRVDWIIDGSDSVLEMDEGNNALSILVELRASKDRTFIDQLDGEHSDEKASDEKASEEGKNLIHLVYALPSDGIDEKWDINGTIESIVASMQSWLRERAKVEGLRFDSKDGVLDITFIRLDQTINQISQSKITSIPLMAGLLKAGLDDPGKIYAVWYPFPGSAGDLNSICGFQSAVDGVRFSFTYFERTEEPEPNRCVNQHTIMLH